MQDSNNNNLLSGRALKVLRVIDTMDPTVGGPAAGIRNSIAELNRSGIINEVVCLDDPTAPFVTGEPFKIYAVGPSNGAWHYSKNLLPWLLANLVNYDVVILHGLWLYHGFAVRRAFTTMRRERVNYREELPKLYIMPHGMLDPYFQQAPERRFKALRNSIYWTLLESKLVADADGLLFTCEEELVLARQTFKDYKPKKEFNVGYGIVEQPAFTPEMQKAFYAKCPGMQKGPYLLYLSRIHPKKGLDLLIEAYTNLMAGTAKQGTSLPKLVIAGPGLESSYGKNIIKEVAQQTALKENVVFTGMLTGDAKWGAFYGCEAFVLPSHQENFGIAVVEALACGKPVLISNQVNIWREIERGKAGIVKKDDLAGTVDLLKTWFNLPAQERLNMAENSRDTFEQNFLLRNSIRKLLDLLYT